ncbi:LysE family transporter [Xanthobacter wiegelii]|uniref:LysE family transporter n=1 Tax=Xanthobacter wiegelii TaxID=3119913 RepID=UPI003727E940
MPDAPPALMVFAGTYAAMVLVPGANFLVVSRASLAGRPIGLAAALGVSAGATANVTAVVIGLLFLSGINPSGDLGWLQLAFCLLYAVLLLRAGISCLLEVWSSRGHAGMAPQAVVQRTGREAFRLGFLTAATNPMSLSFFLASGGLLAAAAGREAMFASPVLVFSVAAGWFGILALLFSAPPARRLYLKMRLAADTCIGGLLAVAGVLVLLRVFSRL